MRLNPLPFIIILIILTSCNHDDLVFSDEVNISVDFSISEDGVKSMSGFLHGINYNSPEDTLIQALAPKLLRVGNFYFDRYEKAKKFNAREILVISDFWARGPGKGFSVMPFDDYIQYEEFLVDLIQKTDGKVIYDIWNEPDVGFIWTGTQEQFFECFKFTHDIIRRELGEDAVISGPSINYLPDWMMSFASYFDRNPIQLDIFSYHDLYETDNFLSVKDHLEFVKREVLYKHSSLDVQEIHVNEYGYNGSQQNPSMILSYLYFLEKGGADGACRACWKEGEEKNIGTCWNGSIGGLLTHNDHRPRASWWAHKYYAESIENRKQSITSNPYALSFAYQDIQTEAAYIIAINAHKHAKINKLNFLLDNISSLSFMNGKNFSVNIKTYTIPNTEDAALEEVELLEEDIYHINSGKTIFTINNVAPMSNYIIEISKAS